MQTSVQLYFPSTHARSELTFCVLLGLVGLAVSYALSITNLLSGVVTSFTETEKQMVSVERADQYIDGVPTEKEESTLNVSWSPTSYNKSLYFFRFQKFCSDVV